VHAGTGRGRCHAPLRPWRAPGLRTLLALALASIAPLAMTQEATAPFSLSLDTGAQNAALALVRQAASALAPAGARVVVQAGALDPRLRLAPCARIEPHLVPGAPPWGATRVGLRCTAGAVAWRAFLPVQVQVLAPAWTSKVALPAGAVLAAEQWAQAEVDWAAAPSPPVATPEVPAGRTLARPVNPGQALREADLLARRWFASGQVVRIVSHGPGFSVMAEGQALNPGIEGQPVRVRTEAGRILVGQAVGDAIVEVQP